MNFSVIHQILKTKPKLKGILIVAVLLSLLCLLIHRTIELPDIVCETKLRAILKNSFTNFSKEKENLPVTFALSMDQETRIK